MQAQKVPVKFAIGPVVYQTSESGENFGRGTGSLWQAAFVKVIRRMKWMFFGKQTAKVFVVMDVPPQWIGLPDTEILERFVKGFNGGKS